MQPIWQVISASDPWVKGYEFASDRLVEVSFAILFTSIASRASSLYTFVHRKKHKCPCSRTGISIISICKMSLKSYIEKIRRCFHFCAFWCRQNLSPTLPPDALQSYSFAGSCSNFGSVRFEQVVWQTPSLGEPTTRTTVVGMLLAIAHFGSSHHASLAEKSLQKNLMQPKEIWGPLHNLS